MKKKILIMLLTSLCVFAGGCGTNDTIRHTKADASIGALDDYGTYEWVSPDGVHYWVVVNGRGYGIAPRYDNDGNLVIDKGAEQ